VSAGFRVFERGPHVSPDLLRAFRELDVGNIADAMHGHGVLDCAIRPVASPGALVGQAVTALLTPGDGFMLRQVNDVLAPGDVLVANAYGDTSRAVLGGSVAMRLQKAGLTGAVVDGSVRDVTEIHAIGFPTFARAAVVRSGSTSSGTGEINGPVACGGVVVLPGDIVVADEEGIAIVPFADATAVLERAREVQSKKGSRSEAASRKANVRVDAHDLIGFEARGGKRLWRRWSSVLAELDGA